MEVGRKRVLLVYGPGSGYGKSTLAEALAAWLESQGKTVGLYPEEAVLEESAFSDYVGQVRKGKALDTEVLLEACEKFIARLRNRGGDVFVLDSIFPCWDWLYSQGASDELVFEFTERLSQLLLEVEPVLILLQGDLDTALQRAIDERGMTWARELAKKRAGGRGPVALNSYFGDLRAGAERAKSRWALPILEVDTVGQDLESSLGTVKRNVIKWLAKPVR